MQYAADYKVSEGDKNLYVISGWTTRIEMQDSLVIEWAVSMCDVGFKNDCDFDGWGTEIDQEQDIDADVNIYDALRSLAFSITPEQIGITLPNDTPVVYGIIMDWNIDGEIATVVSFLNGDASLYLSSGGGYIGGGQKYEDTRNAVLELLEFSQKMLPSASQSNTNDLPNLGMIKIYFLTTNGLFVGQDYLKNIESNASLWTEIFEKINDVVSSIREVAEK